MATGAAGLGFVILGVLSQTSYYIQAGIALGLASGLTGWSTSPPIIPPPHA